jgi:hypothetical protein
MIRPYISDNTNYATSNLLTLTKTADSSSNSLSAIPLYNGNNSSYSAKWTDKSQTFTFSYLETGKYKIGASLAADQYETPAFWIERPVTVHPDDYYDYCVSQYNSSSHEDYFMNEQNSALNWIGSTGETSKLFFECQEWRIIPAGTINIGGESYNKYCIVYIDSNGELKALKHTGNINNTVTIGDFSDVANYQWIIYKVGINVPLIKQTKTYWCGYATVLQSIYGAGTQQYLIQDIQSGSSLLHNQMEEVKNRMGYSTAMDQGSVCSMINNGCLRNYVFPSSTVSYHRTNDQSVYHFHQDPAINNDQDNFLSVLITSFDTGWAPFFLTSTGGAPYKKLSGGAHYISIIGYDMIGDCVLISNCHNDDNIIGIYAVVSIVLCK